jgi:putative Mg2+ transporter-C (MgtC) family protein
VHGLTTAAAVWMTAALGALCGTGEWKIILALSLIVTTVLLVGGAIERWCDEALGKHGSHHGSDPPPRA